jgi:transcriptional regulator with XRE-family HTH domain
MDDQRLGAVIRAVRIRRGLRQLDLADASGVSRATVSLLERGHCETLSLVAIRRIAGAVDVRVDLVGRWRGGDLDRLLNRRHSILAESFAAAVKLAGGWQIEPEVSFSIFGERGVIDQLAWHPETRHLLVVEFKTQLVDINELLGTLGRKRRLIRQIVAARGWIPCRTSVWLVISDTSTNRRHVHEHATLLRSRLPLDGRQLRKLLRNPTEAGSGVSFWSDASGSSTRSGIRTVS